MNRSLCAALILSFALPFAKAADFATEMMEATCKFGPGPCATCFFVRRELPDTAIYLVTVAHAVDDNTAESTTLALRKPKPDGSYERVVYTLPLRREGKPLWVRHPKQDVAVIRLTDPLPVPVPALPISALADEAKIKTAGAHLCSPLFLLGYPQELEADPSGLPVARNGMFASSPLLPLTSHPTFLIDYTAFGGDSGGPVFIAGPDQHVLVVGLASEQHFYSDVMKSINEKHSIRIPLGLVKVVRADFLRETIEAAAK